MIRTSEVVLPEHEAYLRERGFLPSWLDEYGRLVFAREVRRADGHVWPRIYQRIERQKFATGWRVGLTRQWGEGKPWHPIWIAGHTGRIPIHAPGGSLIFDDPVAAFVAAEVEEWGGAGKRFKG